MNIILIEDDPRITSFLNRGLVAEGYRVQVASCGMTGLALARAIDRSAQTGTLILLDLMLPDISGTEVCQTLRAEGIQTPILMLTAVNSLEHRIEGLRMGADDYLCKPFAFEELLARIEALFRRSRFQSPARQAQLQVADLVLDRETMRASRGGVSLNLTARELALLELFMSSPGKLLSRERILSSIWGQNEDPLTNIVDVYIRRLRSKVDSDTNNPLIHTSRGLGYRLESLHS
jgi:DNA-binding response OmpR family regulator